MIGPGAFFSWGPLLPRCTRADIKSHSVFRSLSYTHTPQQAGPHV